MVFQPTFFRGYGLFRGIQFDPTGGCSIPGPPGFSFRSPLGANHLWAVTWQLQVELHGSLVIFGTWGSWKLLWYMWWVEAKMFLKSNMNEMHLMGLVWFRFLVSFKHIQICRTLVQPCASARYRLPVEELKRFVPRAAPVKVATKDGPRPRGWNDETK